MKCQFFYINILFRIALCEQDKKNQSAITNAASGLWGMLKSVTATNSTVESILLTDFCSLSILYA